MCDNCGCRTAEITEVTIQALLEKQAEDRMSVFRPVLKKMVDYLKESDVDAFIEPDEFAAITIVTKNWEASLDLINFYEKEQKKEEVDTRVDVIIDEDDDDDDDDTRRCSSCLSDDDDEPSTETLRTYVAPKKKVVKKPKKGKTTKRKSKGK